MSPLVLATALELSRLQGIRCAASYLCDNEVAIEVAIETLVGSRRSAEAVQSNVVHHSLDQYACTP